MAIRPLVGRYQGSQAIGWAEVVVEPVEGNPGYYQSKFFLRPHYQLEGLTVSSGSSQSFLGKGGG